MTCICKLWMRKLYFTVKEVEILLSWRALKNHSSVHKSIVFYSSIQSMHPFSQLIQLLSAVPITWPCLICNNSLSNGQEQRDYYHSYYSVCCGTLQMWSKKKKLAYRRLYLFQECIPRWLKRDRLQKLQESACSVEHWADQPDTGLLESLSSTSAIYTHPAFWCLDYKEHKKKLSKLVKTH